MIERRNWATRPWARKEGQQDRPQRNTPPASLHLWFLADDEDGETFKPWTSTQDTTYIPCFRSRSEAVELATAAGVPSAYVLGFPLLELPDLMADLEHPVFLVSEVAADGQVHGSYLPQPPQRSSEGIWKVA